MTSFVDPVEPQRFRVSDFDADAILCSACGDTFDEDEGYVEVPDGVLDGVTVLDIWCLDCAWYAELDVWGPDDTLPIDYHPTDVAYEALGYDADIC